MAEKITKIQIGEEVREIGLGAEAAVEIGSLVVGQIGAADTEIKQAGQGLSLNLGPGLKRLSNAPGLGLDTRVGVDCAALAGPGLKEDDGLLTVPLSGASVLTRLSDGLGLRLGTALGTALSSGAPVLQVLFNEGFASDNQNRLSLKLDSEFFTLDTDNYQGWLLQIDTLRNHVVSASQTLGTGTANGVLEVKRHDSTLGTGANGLKVNLSSGLTLHDGVGVSLKLDTSAKTPMGLNKNGLKLSYGTGLEIIESHLCVRVGTDIDGLTDGMLGLSYPTKTRSGVNQDMLGIKLGTCDLDGSSPERAGFYIGSGGQLLPNIGSGNNMFDHANPFAGIHTGLKTDPEYGCIKIDCASPLKLNDSGNLALDTSALSEDEYFVSALISKLLASTYFVGNMKEKLGLS